MPNLVRIAPGALIIGKPLPWTVYDADGNVLLTQGYVIQTDVQLEQLFERGLFYPRRSDTPEPEPEPEEDIRPRNPFSDYPELLRTLEVTLQSVQNQSPDAQRRVIGLANLVARCCREAPDPCLALVHLYSVEPTAYEQTLFYAIICYFTAQQLGMDDKRVLVLLGAALTANLALLPILDKLNQSRRRLSDDQRAIIRKHPILSVAALERAGIDNRLLLKIVSQHHEQPDGSGYPEGLSGRDILPEARMLALAERYTAMITRRAYRDRFSITQARSELAEASHGLHDRSIHDALLKAITAYPPGSLVRLANGEVAVVTHRASGLQGTQAQAIMSPTGNRYIGAFRRDCSRPEYEIQQVEVPEMLPSMDYGQLWSFDRH
ncbi:HD domain-containing protein [Marinobacter halodurans]|uniref:HD domain-containing protein n=1 Tax=Marinobacter halodurans TaxID=2528979 RepID=A0ABY1ZG48_9GAMM|nr:MULTISPECIES: HD domain-containing phosphohydrolase [Marinobacter]TBW47908.1 HD domain-containing protein [Marinobacter halodurans]